MSIGADALAACPEYVREADDGTLAALLDCVGAQVDPLQTWLDNPAQAVDPWTVPFERLPWVAALAGVDIEGVPDADLRAFIASDTTRNRGNVAAIQLRVGLTLTGSKTVLITSPYSGSADRILVQTFTAETPDTAATEAAVRAEVPAWMRLTYQAIAGQTYAQMATDYPTYGDMNTTGKTYGTLATET